MVICDWKSSGFLRRLSLTFWKLSLEVKREPKMIKVMIATPAGAPQRRAALAAWCSLSFLASAILLANQGLTG